MRVALGSDHAGFALKEDLKPFLAELQVSVEDVGPTSADRVDYPDYAALVANAVISGRADRGILVCGSGIGMSIAANKVPGIRAALLFDERSALLSRHHNDANVMAIGGRTTPPDLARTIVRIFLEAPFDGGRHQLRLEKIAALERAAAHRDHS